MVQELINWDFETVELVTNCDRLSFLKHSSVNPLVFNEQGIAMLSSILHSEKAIRINNEIMRAFAKYRAFIHENEKLKNELHALDKKFTQLQKMASPEVINEKIDQNYHDVCENKSGFGKYFLFIL